MSNENTKPMGTFFGMSGSSPPRVVREFGSLVVILTAALVVFSLAAVAMPATTVRIVDGDTVKVGATTHRLYGIDAPESAQEHGPASKAMLSSLLASCRSPRFEVRDTDRYGRSVSVIRCSGRKLSVNEQLVKSGAAWHYRAYAACSVREVGGIDCSLAMLESEAMKAKRGLWSAKNPTPPWEWRKAKRGAR